MQTSWWPWQYEPQYLSMSVTSCVWRGCWAIHHQQQDALIHGSAEGEVWSTTNAALLPTTPQMDRTPVAGTHTPVMYNAARECEWDGRRSKRCRCPLSPQKSSRPRRQRRGEHGLYSMASPKLPFLVDETFRQIFVFQIVDHTRFLWCSSTSSPSTSRMSCTLVRCCL